MKKSIITVIGMIILIITSAGIFAEGPGSSTLTRAITPSSGPPGQIFTVKLIATKGSQEMAGIISETKPSGFTFYDADNWISNFDLMVNGIDGDFLDIAFAESGASGYYEYKLQAGSSSGELSGGVIWDDETVDDLEPITLTVCIDDDDDGYSVTGGLCGEVDCNDNNPSINPGAEEIPKNGIDDNCDGIDLSFMVVNSPQQAYYNDKKVIFNISLLGEADYLQYLDLNDTRPKNKTICRDCNEYGLGKEKTKNLVDGEHNLIFYAIKDDKVYREGVTLFIDSKDPRISKTSPRRNSYTNGSSFYIKFKEENPILLSVSYNPEINLDLGVCEGDKPYKECYYDLNLTEYDGSEIEYSFKLIDIANNTGESRLTKIKVDTTPPKILKFANWTSGRYAYFNITINETNFDAVQYIDTSNTKAVWKPICSSLKNSICYKSISFREGQHDVFVRVLDKAGNSVEKEVKFMI